MTKDIDTTAAFAGSAQPAGCDPAKSGYTLGIQAVSPAGVGLPLGAAALDLDLSAGLDLDLDLSAGPDIDLSEGPGYVDSGIKDAATQQVDPAADRVSFQAQGLHLRR